MRLEAKRGGSREGREAALGRLGIPPGRGELGWSSSRAWRQAGDEVMREAFNDRSSDHARRTAVEFNRRVQKALRLVVWAL